MEMAYNNVWRIFIGYDPFSRANKMFVENRFDKVYAGVRGLFYMFGGRIIASRNALYTQYTVMYQAASNNVYTPMWYVFAKCYMTYNHTI